MHLEATIEKLVAALASHESTLKEHIKALGGKAVAAAVAGATKPAAAAYKPQHTKDEMKAACKKLKDTDGSGGLEAVSALITETTGAAKMDEVNDPKLIDKMFDVATARIAELSGGDDGM